MAQKLSQSLKQTQNLMMTPQLQQAIKLLTLTHLEMTTVIAKEMVENPILEESESGESTEKKNDTDYKVEKLEMETKEAKAENFDEPTVMNKDDFDWNSYIDTYNNSASSAPSMVSKDLDELPNYENIVSRGKTLAEHLEWQLRMENLIEKEWKVAYEIIHNINNDGYLGLPIDDIIATTGHDREDTLEILKMIQRLDPVGCGAENLKDCLLVQARVLEERSPLLEILITGHLEDIQCKDYEKISKVTGVEIDKIKECLLLLHSFHPKPGRLITSDDIHYVVPDIYVVQMGSEFVVKLNDEGVPRLKISKFYQSMLKSASTSRDPSTKEYVEDKLRSAMWLIKSIHNRQKTILRVSKALVARQQEFFKKGVENLKPMILKDIAQEIGVHESTVSRVTTNKYMHTPIGLFELKYFFNAGLGGKNGGVDVSSEVLKLKIKALVANENPVKPISDQKIAELLSREGVAVARRTVAKYRETLGILSSSKRRKRKP